MTGTLVTITRMGTDSPASVAAAIVNRSHVEAGLITRIRVTFDPRPLLA